MKPINHDFVRREAAKELARRSMADFTLYTDDGYRMNGHHRVICEQLDLWARRDIRRLMIFAPPRHGKSELVSRKLPAYLFGLYPDISIISASYSADLASRMNRDVQRIIDSEKYAELFPATRLFGKNVRSVADGSFLRNSDIFEVVGRRGTYRSAGVGGGITGMGGDYIIIDDPVKSREEANSNTYRDRLWAWYASTLYTRLEKDGCILVTLTRWHEDDLAGRLLLHQADDWTVLRLPAVCEAPAMYDPRRVGEPLWSDKYDADALAEIKRAVGSYEWNALYQQRPAPQEGGMFKRSWWKRWESLPEDLHIVQSWDCTFKGSESSDYVVGQVWGKKGADRYLIDQVRGRKSFTQTLQAVRDLSERYPKAHKKLVEDAANGSAVIDLLKSEIPGLVPVRPKGGKESRAHAATAYVESGNVLLPANAEWVEDFIEEAAAFPNGANDDQVDAMTQANIYYDSVKRAGTW
jgi:predicted phage terminase large subunit-like protein